MDGVVWEGAGGGLASGGCVSEVWRLRLGPWGADEHGDIG